MWRCRWRQGCYSRAGGPLYAAAGGIYVAFPVPFGTICPSVDRHCSVRVVSRRPVCCAGQGRVAEAAGRFLPCTTSKDKDASAYFFHTGLSLARSAELEGVGEWLPTPPPPGATYRGSPTILFVVRDDAKLGLTRLGARELPTSTDSIAAELRD